jgi:CCR4-NOT transcription complex subunit 7/8
MTQMGFARGGPVQAHQNYDGLGAPLETKDDARIRNVWKHNLKEEMATLRQLVDSYPYIAMVRIF